MTDFTPALAVANAVLYEGYLLYPYTASAGKNRVRWQFGVVVPQAYARTGTGEAAEQHTEVLLDAPADGSPRVTVLLRFLHVEARSVEAFADGTFTPVSSLTVDGKRSLTFDEAVERAIAVELEPARCAEHIVPIAFPDGRDEELLRDAAGEVRGRIVRERWPLHGTLRIRCERRAGLRALCVHVENDSAVVAGERSGALRTAFVSTHVLLGVEGGRFISVLDPPEEAVDATTTLANRHAFPVLIGAAAGDEHHAALALSSPIILYDFPEVAARTDADAFDATEIDELLTLSVLSLPDEERAEARDTDPRARAIVERAERFGAAELGRLHEGTLLRDPFAALDVPALDCVFVAGTKVCAGSAVVLHPKRRADVWDTFLEGKAATVRAIHQDLDDALYVAVTVDDDPATDLHAWYGRSFFFSPDEIEPARGAS